MNNTYGNHTGSLTITFILSIAKMGTNLTPSCKTLFLNVPLNIGIKLKCKSSAENLTKITPKNNLTFSGTYLLNFWNGIHAEIVEMTFSFPKFQTVPEKKYPLFKKIVSFRVPKI